MICAHARVYVFVMLCFVWFFSFLFKWMDHTSHNTNNKKIQYTSSRTHPYTRIHLECVIFSCYYCFGFVLLAFFSALIFVRLFIWKIHAHDSNDADKVTKLKDSSNRQRNWKWRKDQIKEMTTEPNYLDDTRERPSAIALNWTKERARTIYQFFLWFALPSFICFSPSGSKFSLFSIGSIKETLRRKRKISSIIRLKPIWRIYLRTKQQEKTKIQHIEIMKREEKREIGRIWTKLAFFDCSFRSERPVRKSKTASN